VEGEEFARMLSFLVGRVERSRVPPWKGFEIAWPVSALISVRLVTAVVAALAGGGCGAIARSDVTASSRAKGTMPREAIGPPVWWDRHPGRARHLASELRNDEAAWGFPLESVTAPRACHVPVDASVSSH
jgi:hypothetical protein